MAGEKGNGHDPSTARMVEVLERIEREMIGMGEELRGTNARVDGTNARLDALHEELHAFRTETRDELLDLHAGQHQLRMELKTSIEARLGRLEAAVFPPTGT